MANIADPNLISQPALGMGGMVSLRTMRRPLDAGTSAVGALVDFHQELEHRQREFRRQAFLERSNALFSEQLIDKEMELQDDDDPATRTERFAEYGETLARSMADQIEDPWVREVFEVKTLDKINARRLTVFQRARRDEMAAEQNNLIDSLRIYRAGAIRAEAAGNELDRDLAITDAVNAIDATRFDTELQRGNTTRAFFREYDRDRVLYKISVNDFEGARELLAGEELASLEEDQKLALETRIDRAEAKFDREIDEASAKDRAEELFFLERDIRSAAADPLTTAEQLQELRERNIDWWRAAGPGSVGTAIANDAEIDKIATEQREHLRNAVTIEKARELKISLNPSKYQDAVDDYYTNTFLPSLEGKPPEEIIDATISLVEDIDLVPKQVSDDLISYAQSDDPQYAALGGEMLARLKEASPQAPRNIGRQYELYLENIDRGIRLNRDPAAVLEREREILKTDEATIKERKARYQASVKEEGIAGYLGISDSNQNWLLKHDAFSEIRRAWRLDPGVDVVPSEMLGPFSAEVERWVMAGATLEQARKNAFDVLNMTWGATEADGHRRIMNFAIEKMYPEIEGRSEWVQAQLERETQGIAFAGRLYSDSFEKVPGTIDLSGRLFLKDDLDTPREERPGYSVHLLDENGEYAGQLFQAAGDAGFKALRYYPELEIMPEYQALQAREARFSRDRHLAEAYLEKGDESALELMSVGMRWKVKAHRALQLAAPIMFDQDQAIEDYYAMAHRVSTASDEGTERAIRENRELLDAMQDIARRAAASYPDAVSASREALRRRDALMRIRARRRRRLLKGQIEAAGRKLKEANVEIGERIRRVEPSRVAEPAYTRGWLGKVEPRGG